MNGNFGKLLDEQKKSNEQLSTISQTLINDGSAKEIIKQSLPEVLNERQLAGRRDKFFKKTGMTETDNQVEKLIGRINELVVVEKSTNQKTKKQVDELGDFLKETKSPLLQIYKNSRNRSLTKAVMDKNQKLFQKKFYGYEDTKAIRMKKEIELAEKEIKQRKIGLEKQGKNAEKDIAEIVDKYEKAFYSVSAGEL